MRPYSEAVKADVRRRMGPPHRQSVTEISQELGIHVITLYKWRKAWRLQGEVVPASQKYPEGWGPADKFTVVLEAAGLNATELGGYCRERGLFPEQTDRWRGCMNVTCEAKVCRRVLFGSNSSNTSLEWSGHHQLSTEASLIPLPATQGQR